MHEEGSEFSHLLKRTEQPALVLMRDPSLAGIERVEQWLAEQANYQAICFTSDEQPQRYANIVSVRVPVERGTSERMVAAWRLAEHLYAPATIVMDPAYPLRSAELTAVAAALSDHDLVTQAVHPLLHRELVQPFFPYHHAFAHERIHGVGQRLARHWQRHLSPGDHALLTQGTVQQFPASFSAHWLEPESASSFIEPTEFTRHVHPVLDGLSRESRRVVHSLSHARPSLDELDRYHWNDVFHGASSRVQDWWETTLPPRTVDGIRRALSHEGAGITSDSWQSVLSTISETVRRDPHNIPITIEAIYPLFAARLLG